MPVEVKWLARDHVTAPLVAEEDLELAALPHWVVLVLEACPVSPPHSGLWDNLRSLPQNIRLPRRPALLTGFSSKLMDMCRTEI